MKIEINHLSFAYAKKDVLKGINLCLGERDIYCLLGANGAGKSTLLRCMMGFEKFDGEIKIDGKNLAHYSSKELAHKIAYIGQKSTQSFGFRVLDVVLMGRMSYMGIFGIPSSKDIQKAVQNLEFLGIAHLRDRLYTELSGGEARLVMIASVLTQESELLILDEPTAYLDFTHTHYFLKLIKKLKQRGIKILMSTHFPHHALEVGGYVLVLKDKTIILEGECTQVLTDRNLKEIYGIDVKVREIESAFVSYCND